MLLHEIVVNLLLVMLGVFFLFFIVWNIILYLTLKPDAKDDEIVRAMMWIYGLRVIDLFWVGAVILQAASSARSPGVLVLTLVVGLLIQITQAVITAKFSWELYKDKILGYLNDQQIISQQKNH